MSKAEVLIVKAIIKAAEERKIASNILPALANTFKSRIVSTAFQSLQRPEAITSAIAFTDQAEDAMKMFKITNALLKARRLEQQENQDTDFAEPAVQQPQFNNGPTQNFRR